MFKGKDPLAISHWHNLVENFSTSSLDFYTAVTSALKRREVPGAETSKVEYHEGGVLSAKRVYLRVTRERLAFDICAAPFGTGFFFSSWLRWVPPSLPLVGCITVFLFLAFAGFILEKGGLTALFAVTLIVLVLLWALGALVRAGELLSEDMVLALPFFGPLYERVFKPETYYRLDTALMYQEAVHGAVMEVLDGLMSGKGLRALSPEERKPHVRDLVR
jgi:hypothetical protein